MCLESKVRAEAVSEYCTYSIGLHHDRSRQFNRSTAEADEITVETGIEVASIEMEVHTAEAGGGLFTTSLHTLIN